MKYSEYRNGNDKENHVRKVPNINTTDDVTLKRGIIGDLRLFDWLKATREGDLRARAPSPSRCSTRRAPRSCTWMLQQRPAEEVGRPDAGRQGRRRGRDGGAAPGRRADRLRVVTLTTGLARWGARGLPRPGAERRALSRSPARRRGLRRRGPARAGRPARPGHQLVGLRAAVRRLRAAPGGPAAAAVRRPGVLRARAVGAPTSCESPRTARASDAPLAATATYRLHAPGQERRPRAGGR